MKKSSTLIKKEIGFNIFNTTLMVFLCIVMLLPFIYLVSVSLMKESMTITSIIPDEVSLDAYKKILTSKNIYNGYFRTIIRTGLGTVLSMVFIVLTAYPLSKKTFPNRTLWTSFIVFTMFFNGGLIPRYILIKQLALRDTIWALVLPQLIQTFYMLIVRNYFMSIPDSLEESAKIDGAKELHILFWIIVPVSLPILVTVSLWNAVWHWNQWFDSLIYTRTPTKYVLQMVLRRIVIEGTSEMVDFGGLEDAPTNIESVKAAAILVTTLPILLVYPFIQKYFIHGIMVGSLKG